MRVIVEKRAFLVEEKDELIEAIRSMLPSDRLDYTDDEVLVREAIVGFESLPNEFPYVLVTHYMEDDSWPHVVVFGITKDMFDII